MALLIHQVWFKFKAEATAEQIDAVMRALAALKGEIACIRELSVGKNLTQRSKGACP
jgi:hypothetical protein